MLYSKEEVGAIASKLALQETPYIKGIVELIKKHYLDGLTNSWQDFGPYCWNIQDLMRKYAPNDKRVEEWGDRPDYLEHYDYGNDFLNAVSSMMYLNREGHYRVPDLSHSIVLADGSLTLYHPDAGILE